MPVTSATCFFVGMHQITGRTRLAGVIGDPVEHSRSPRLHNHWLARYGIDGLYVPLRVAPARVGVALAGLEAAGFVGLNVTLPHKEAAYRLVDRREPSAERSGAVNTIVFRDGEAIGSNTDGEGFIANLKANDVQPGGRVLLLGAGGAARAIAASLLDCDCSVTISNRDSGRSKRLCADLPQLVSVPWETRTVALKTADLLVNTTSVGLQDPSSSPIRLSDAPPTLVVADIVYMPRQTRLLKQAAEQGLRTVDGLGMLLHQARPGFRAWFGIDPVVDPALEAATAGDLLQSGC